MHLFQIVRSQFSPRLSKMNKLMNINDAVENIKTIANTVLHGSVIALPTDTIYGLACSAQNIKALNQLYEIKDRSTHKPMAICLDQISSISYWCDTKSIPSELFHDLLPGPVTLVLPRYAPESRDPLHPQLNPGVDRVGIRIPDYGFVRLLVKTISLLESNFHPPGIDHPLVLTSANLSGHTSALRVEEFNELWDSLNVIIDGGPICSPTSQSDLEHARAGSTIIDLTRCSESVYSVIRTGNALDQTVAILENKYHLKRSD